MFLKDFVFVFGDFFTFGMCPYFAYITLQPHVPGIYPELQVLHTSILSTNHTFSMGLSWSFDVPATLHPPLDPSSFSLVFTGVLCNEDIALQLVPLSLVVFFFFRSVSLALALQYCKVSTFSITLLWPSFFLCWLVTFLFPRYFYVFVLCHLFNTFLRVLFCSPSAFSRLFSLLFPVFHILFVVSLFVWEL